MGGISTGTRKYTVGVDFGTESGRAVLVEVGSGLEVSTAVVPYLHGVIDERLPGSGVLLEPGWALQDPEDLHPCLSKYHPKH